MKKQFKRSTLILFAICAIISCTNTKSNSSQIFVAKPENSKDTDSILVINTTSTKAKMVEYETLNGWLKESLDQQIVIDSIGLPESKDKDLYMGAMGSYVQQWNYKSIGITLDMESEQENGNKKVMRITIISPCTLTTSQGIGIGSDLKLIKVKYNSQIDKSASDESTIVVGTIYDGLIFSLESNKVVKMFIGASAE